MPIDFKNSGERYAQRAKRRKTNIILNTLIVIVIILIILVGSYIFFGGDNNKDQASEVSNAKDTTQSEEVKEPKDKNEKTTDDEKSDDDDSEKDEPIETESDEPNVEKVIKDPSWKPIGTEQASGHQSSYNMGTVDWNEKLSAAAYAVGISVDNMTPWWVEGGSDREKEAILTVSEKVAGSDVYRVYIEWVDGEGWKPTEVKKLIENDKKQ
ncbi:YrrS family protein [Lederbergia lenta]|uniref:YrrS n=1 Tax=Lederbergia lenta TaxID=1467 RepID=A0A2X4W794_LEDLE|nr:YrrS family protein [Lederbergia lenta]MCM3111333.1 YrrS family protein [Lederbergia lenta]MEC2325280.1 YrrS family protein [Lederbergia lenta]SQI55858.1 YrrS [Lederbergia lenta]